MIQYNCMLVESWSTTRKTVVGNTTTVLLLLLPLSLECSDFKSILLQYSYSEYIVVLLVVESTRSTQYSSTTGTLGITHLSGDGVNVE
jgi:hypothetical protein